MKIHYVGYFKTNDKAEQPLLDYFADLESEQGTYLEITRNQDAERFATQLLSLTLDDVDILIVGAHGHGSLTGFYVGDEPTRWHELASKLKGRLPASCSFIFYSCNGGYSGIAHIFDGASGPDFAFGPYIRVDADAMKYAVRRIVEWKRKFLHTPKQACELVDEVNQWAKEMYPNRPYNQSFLRVHWRDGHKNLRHPKEPGPDKPTLPLIPLKTSL
jgi:hypothetical protein